MSIVNDITKQSHVFWSNDIHWTQSASYGLSLRNFFLETVRQYFGWRRPLV